MLTIIQGNALTELRKMPDESVQMGVTSPPYFGLRDYRTKGTWSGGDPECDHVEREIRTGLGLAEWSATNARGGGHKAGDVDKIQYSGTCEKCGATRSEWIGGDPNCDHRGRSQTSDASTLGDWKNGGGQRYKENTGGMPFHGDCEKCGATKAGLPIWGGAEDCDHQWEEHIQPAANGIIHEGGMSGETLPGNSATRRPKRSHFCLKCKAWRGSLGLEPTPDLYVEHLVLIFREFRRVLRKDGVLWLNLGDSYANDGKWGGHTGGKHAKALHCSPVGRSKRYTGLKPKDLIGIPWRVAFALQADGWWLRSDCIWNKPNPMPESVTDRPTKSHEYLFLLTKSEHYYYDAEAIKEPQVEYERQRRLRERAQGLDTVYNLRRDVQTGLADQSQTGGVRNVKRRGELAVDGTRNKRSVWTVATTPYEDAHFATYPPELIKPCILAGTSAKGCCPECGAPWERIVEREQETRDPVSNPKAEAITDNGDRQDGRSRTRVNTPEHGHAFVSTTGRTIGWNPTCNCGHLATNPCVVLDPFGGSGTTAEVANGLGRDAIVIELNPDYIPLIKNRAQLPLFT